MMSSDSTEEVEMLSDQAWLAESATVLTSQKGAYFNMPHVLASRSGDLDSSCCSAASEFRCALRVLLHAVCSQSTKYLKKVTWLVYGAQ